MTQKPSILLVDDHEVVRRGCRALLEQAGYKRCFEAADIGAAMDIFHAEKPRMVVLDISLGGENGLSIIARIRALDRGCAILVFTMHEDPVYALRVMRAGAMAYITKTSAPESLLTAIERVGEGHVYLGPDLARRMAWTTLSGNESPADALSPRELQVHELVVAGYGNPQVAETLGISQKSVSNNLIHIKRKLGVDCIADLVRLALLHEQRLDCMNDPTQRDP